MPRRGRVLKVPPRPVGRYQLNMMNGTGHGDLKTSISVMCLRIMAATMAVGAGALSKSMVKQSHISIVRRNDRRVSILS